MSEMVERVARALCRWQCERNARDEQIEALGLERAVDYSWPVWAEQARAAIEAMRVPTEKMCDACVSGLIAPEHVADEAWRAMIEVALGEREA